MLVFLSWSKTRSKKMAVDPQTVVDPHMQSDMSMDDWPKAPIWLQHFDSIRELLTEEEWKVLLRRLVHIMPGGPLVSAKGFFGKPHPKGV